MRTINQVSVDGHSSCGHIVHMFFSNGLLLKAMLNIFKIFLFSIFAVLASLSESVAQEYFWSDGIVINTSVPHLT